MISKCWKSSALPVPHFWFFYRNFTSKTIKHQVSFWCHIPAHQSAMKLLFKFTPKFPMTKSSIVTSNSLDKATRMLIDGSRRPCSYIPMALELTCNRPASSAWLQPFLCRNALICRLNIFSISLSKDIDTLSEISREYGNYMSNHRISASDSFTIAGFFSPPLWITVIMCIPLGY